MGMTSIGRTRMVWIGCFVWGTLCAVPSARGWQTPPRGSSAPEPDSIGRSKAGAAEETASETSAANRFTPPAPEAQQAWPEPIVLDVEAARFKDAQPGVTTRQQLESSWGPPIDARNERGLMRYVYELEGFKQVTVALREGKVVSIVIDMAQSHPADQLVRELGLGDQRWVLVRDELGNELGQSQPERGVLLSFKPDGNSREVDQLIVEAIDAQPFVQRAATSLEDRCRESLADVDYALTLAPSNAKAHWIRARVLVRFGRWQEALEAAERAVRLAPDEAEYRLTRGLILGELGFYARAVEDSKWVIDESSSRAELTARGLVQLGNQIAAGPNRDYKSAIKHHLEAIRVAEPLKNDRRPAVRRAARRAIIDAHLAVAGDIAWGAWKRKTTVVPKWIQRAETIAAKMVDRGDGDDELLLVVTRGALAADVGLGGALDPSGWSALLIEKGSRLIQQTSDPVARRHRQWELGMALYDALQIALMRDEPEQGLEYGMLAAEYLQRGSVIGQELPGHAYLMGRLYFRLGSVYAVDHGDHLKAVDWFDRSVPLMEKPIPVSSLADTGRQGETFVSMAISYWAVGQSEEALRLTNRGLEFMKKALQEGILQPSALAVPYHNLARIHHRLGNDREAREYERLAIRHQTTERR